MVCYSWQSIINDWKWCQALHNWHNFTKFNVKKIETIGKEFDHNFHDAVGHEFNESLDEDIILKEIQPGYILNEKVLQPAKVIINKKDIKSEAGVITPTKDK